MKLLIPVDGSDVSLRAVDHVISKMSLLKDAELHLLNVQPPLPAGGHAAAAIGRGKVEEYHREEGVKDLATARQKLDAAGIKYHFHIAVGEPAEVIAHYARQHGIDEIVMGTRGRGAVARALLGSVATSVLESSGVPVALVK